MRPIRAGLIGLGYWGPRILRNLAAHPDIDVLRACDRHAENIAAAARTHPRVEIGLSANDVLSDSRINLVVVATQASTHYDLVHEALLAGKNVLVEKPFTGDYGQALKLVALARRKRRLLFVDHTYLFSEPFRAVRRVIKERALGRLYSYCSNRSDFGRFQSDAGALRHLVYHDLYMVLDLFDACVPIEAGAHGAAHVISGSDDIATARLKTRSGLDIFLSASMLSPVKERRISISGADGLLHWEDGSPQGVRLMRKTATLDANGRPVYVDSGTTAVEYPDREPLRNELDELVDSFHGRAQSRSTGLHALRVLKIVRALEDSSSRGGRLVRIKTS